jgi:hypothetical protein
MLIATALAVALTINVSVAPDLSTTFVSRVLAETDDIWRSAGMTFAWQRAPRGAAATLQVVIGHDARPVRDGRFALGWITFENSKPEQVIYVSYSNAHQLMIESQGVVGAVDRMTLLQRETLLARAMGRALAHEIGHYLLASKAHTLTGLMRSRVPATELFSTDHRQFVLDNGQRSSITAWLGREGIVASR